jgi:enoyl-CoA hydratase/carnithine racemase
MSVAVEARGGVLVITIDRPGARNAIDAAVAEGGRRRTGWPPGEAWTRQAAIAGPVFASEDAREGTIAFAEKRPPVGRGP